MPQARVLVWNDAAPPGFIALYDHVGELTIVPKEDHGWHNRRPPRGDEKFITRQPHDRYLNDTDIQILDVPPEVCERNREP